MNIARKRLRDVTINTDAIQCVRGTPKRATTYKGRYLGEKGRFFRDADEAPAGDDWLHEIK
jgi:hypothetical protein